jgi:hypothetical protein
LSGGERGVLARIGRAGEIHVERNEAGAARAQPVDQSGMDAARPGPAAKCGDATGIDLDDRDLAGGPVEAKAGAQVPAGLFEARAQARQKEGEPRKAGDDAGEEALARRGPAQRRRHPHWKLRATPSRRRCRSAA